jgi:hypothetical protein
MAEGKHAALTVLPHEVPLHEDGHVIGVPHCPSAPHVSCCVGLAQRVSLGAQTPPQAFPLQTKGHVVAFVHCPHALHVCWVPLEHSVAPGVHTAVPFGQPHVLPTHATGHAIVLLH